MAGNTAALAARFAESNWSAVFHFLFVIGAFFSGTVISSMIAAGGQRFALNLSLRGGH